MSVYVVPFPNIPSLQTFYAVNRRTLLTIPNIWPSVVGKTLCHYKATVKFQIKIIQMESTGDVKTRAHNTWLECFLHFSKIKQPRMNRIKYRNITVMLISSTTISIELNMGEMALPNVKWSDFILDEDENFFCFSKDVCIWKLLNPQLTVSTCRHNRKLYHRFYICGIVCWLEKISVNYLWVENWCEQI